MKAMLQLQNAVPLALALVTTSNLHACLIMNIGLWVGELMANKLSNREGVEGGGRDASLS